MTIKVIAGNNAQSNTYWAETTDTLHDFLTTNGISFASGAITFNTAPISPDDLYKTFGELGVTGEPGKDTCYLFVVAKLNNAA